MLLFPAGWLGLAYLGYWAAQILDRVLVPLIALPLLGAPLSDCRITAFRVTLENADVNLAPALATLVQVAPLLIETVFLMAILLGGQRIRPAALGIATHFAGLWVVLLLASQVVLLGYLGRGALVRLLVPLLGPAPFPPAKRIAVSVLAALVLLAAGRIAAGRLIAQARSVWRAARHGWLALLVVIAPLLLIIAAAFNLLAGIHFGGPRVLIYLLIPAAACFLIALLALVGKPTAAAATALGWRGAMAALCMSAALYAAAEQAPGLRRWLAERHLQHLSSAHYDIAYDSQAYSAEILRTFAGERERTLTAEAERAGVSLERLRLRVVVYPELAALRVAAATERAYRVDGTTIRTVLNDAFDQLDPAADAAALLDTAWGKPSSERIGEWTARWLAGVWHGHPVDEAAGQIEAEAGHYTLAQIADNGSGDTLSPLVSNALGGAWIGTVFDQGGIEAVRKVYSAKSSVLTVTSLARALGSSSEHLERDWQQRTAAMAARASAAAADPPAQSLGSDFFFRGISFSFEGFSGTHGGYASPEAREQLKRLAEMGANAIAVVPYGFARGANEQAIFYVGTGETDEELIGGLRAAHRLGLRVMLKPQLWVGRGAFSGTIQFDDPAARAAWMRNYRDFILHYARLAELEGFDVLAIGTELEGVTPYADDWRRLIAKIRRVYHGPLTYAANWGKECETLGFWDALDYIGVNNYYPLATQASARAEDLLPGAQELAEKLGAISQKWHRPVVFTEIGYPSARGGASEPWKEDAGRGVNLDEQAAAYEAVFRAFSPRPWFRGMFWWKWPSNGRGGGPRDSSYTPMGKPAAEVMRGWFKLLAYSEKLSPTKTP